MREGLVKYIGHRRGKFSMRVGSYPARPWATQQPYHERWLPEAEARMWEHAGPWRVTRWRESQEAVPSAVVMAAPAPPAVHMATALEEAEQATRQAESKLELVDASFVMSTGGIVHLAGCKNAPDRPYKTFGSLERAMADEEFNKVHQPCCRQHLKTMNEAVLTAIAERRGAAVSQMNSLGEAYGLEQDEA